MAVQALTARKMWDNTIIVFLGDNGAPNNNAGANTIFKGMKFSHWEGGHRVPAFIGGPGVSASPTLSGKWYNGTVHLVDLHATLLDLGGAVPQHPAGTIPIDGVSLVQVMNGSVGLSESVRSELWIADDVLRVGDFKLITGSGTGPSTCMVGIGGRPVPPANDPNDLNTTCGTMHCTGNETDPADALICSGCKCPSYTTGGEGCTPCLFNVVADPGETTNLASKNPAKVAAMTARVLELAKGTAHPEYPASDMAAACEAMVAAGGFFVPWAEPPPPPPPPGPPASAATLSGRWKMGDIGTIELTASGLPGSLELMLSNSTCGGCCWKTGNGTSAAGPGGGVLHVVAQGAGCDSDRVCTGTVSPSDSTRASPVLASEAGEQQSLEITWACTCGKPLRDCGAFGTVPWTK